jgi:squalene cyclase
LKDCYLKLLAFLTITFVPKHFWWSREKVSYDFFPSFIFSIRNKVGNKLKNTITSTLLSAMNSDGSHSGFTVPTIFCAAFLQETGNEKLFRKALEWLSRARNPNGSYKPLIFLDIFETSWACMALADSSVESSIDWMKKHQVSGGFPYYSYSYCLDVDDTSLVTLASVLCNAVDDVTKESVKWLLDAQNPDGGWGTYPKYDRLRTTFFNILARVPGFVSIRDYHEHRSASMIDMTARAMITLSHFKEEKRVKNAIGKGARFLLKGETKQRGFIGFQRWIDSDIYENALALIALQRNGFTNAQLNQRVEWLASQGTMIPEEAAHLLWLLHEGNVAKSNMNNIVNRILSKQRANGSWEPSLPLASYGEHYFCPVFSTAFNLFCLKTSTRRC